ncbi:MAG: exodeoxyribonuclease VII large subunit [Candidatus Epulonipiscioides saccharophilum]|nr:MAG: exodeoxyribonuclease VII large subunit [Epulopiscium sp. AS2M-Bin001]
MDKQIISIAELNKYVAALLDRDYILDNIWLRAEISNVTYHKSGHVYFTLKDSQAGIDATMFSRNASKLTFRLNAGLKVLVRAKIGLYEKAGKYQAYVYEIEREGLGILYEQFLALKDKLAKKGYADNKQILPKYPGAVGIITSSTGAALHDILKVARRRNKTIPIYIYPASVQGQFAESEIVKAIKQANKDSIVDVIILGRGGGSIEDLWCFNEENVAEAIYQSKIPIVSAVGHEVDFTISDFVADYRAATPSMAAEIVFPTLSDISTNLKYIFKELNDLVKVKLNDCYHKMDILLNHNVFKDVTKSFQQKIQEVDILTEELQTFSKNIITDKKVFLDINIKQLEKLSPLATISRGFSIITANDVLVTNLDSITIGTSLNIRIADGNITAIVINKDKLG